MDIKKTLQSAGYSQYWLAKQLDRPIQQINRWCNRSGISKVWQERLTEFFKNKNIEIK